MADLLVFVAPFVVAAAFLMWWRRSRQLAAERESVELLLLLRSPRTLDETHLRSAAERAFGHAPESVTAKEPGGFLEDEGYAFAVLPVPQPMAPDPEKAAESITELRMKVAFSEHRALVIVSCRRWPEGATREDAYARLGRLAAEFVDDTTLLVYCPETGTGNLANEETLAGLRGGDPLATMRKVNFEAIGLVSTEDPRMVEATTEARRRLPEFVAAWTTASDRSAYLVKAPFTDGTHTEHMWLHPTAIEGETIRGTLANKPFQVRGLREGSEVTVAFGEISDWGYVDEDGPKGMFTEAIVRGAL